MGAFDSFATGLGEKPKATVSIEPLQESELSNRVSQAQQAYKDQFGKELPITSRERSYAKQKELFDRAKRGEKGVYMPVNPDLDKKETYHTNAVDISSEVPESFLNQFGLHRPLGKKDPVHTVLMPEEMQKVSYTPEKDDMTGFMEALQKGSLSEKPTEKK